MRKGPIKFSGLVGSGKIQERTDLARSAAFDTAEGPAEKSTPLAGKSQPEAPGSGKSAGAVAPVQPASASPEQPEQLAANTEHEDAGGQPQALAADLPESSSDSAAEQAPAALDHDLPLLPGQRFADHPSMRVKWDEVTDWTPYLNRELMLPIAMLVDSIFQSAGDSGSRYDIGSLVSLGESMTTGHQEEAIQVRWVGGRFELIIGHRRTRGAKEAGWTFIRAIIRSYSDYDAQLARLASNRSRKDEFHYTLGKAFNAIYTHPDPSLRLSQRKIGMRFDMSQSTVSKCIAMAALPQPMVDLLEKDPGLFNSSTSEIIRSLYENYPNDGDLILKAVLRLKEGASENSILPWFKQMYANKMAGRIGGTEAQGVKERIVTAQNGSPLVSLSLRGRAVHIKLENAGINENDLAERIYKWLAGVGDEIVANEKQPQE
ncbi:ParB/RepB/Spo0J family partition protein [Massilia sp. CMS3.1]|uniref:ParB/RepB/Spo0J family partition protein n=1 Tax=Massilia sp. CMS3.1 TaxID=3373083 RepID=UPI003EE78FCE